jgi:hypothetical protein
MRSFHGWVAGTALASLLWAGDIAFSQPPGPAPPTNLTVKDHPFDGGHAVDLSWELSAEDPGPVTGYSIARSMTKAEIANADADQMTKAIRAAKAAATEEARAAAQRDGLNARDTEASVREARRVAAANARTEIEAQLAAQETGHRFKFVTLAIRGTSQLTINGLDKSDSYVFQVTALAPGGQISSPALTAAPFQPTAQWFDGGRFYLLIIVIVFGGSVVYFIERASSGVDLKVRKIAGLEAVDEAVGRATEMGRPVLYVPGIQDMNEIQTIASMTILARVSRTAANYEVKVEVPTSRSLVMTTAREIVEAAFMEAGKPDAYQRDLIYYVTDEQFGFVAYLSGLMVREKPAACFYLGAFFAESLILAETGNAIGAIQVAGTAMPAQLPFFVAACDYTLIGEEFFAASAYLSGSPEELGSLKGQDVGKVIVGIVLVAGVAMATLASITGSEALMNAVDYLKHVILT